MKTMPKFSVAIPVYNRSDYLRRAIASCLAQTLSDFEVVARRRTSALWCGRLMTRASFITGPKPGLALVRIIKERLPFPMAPTSSTFTPMT